MKRLKKFGQACKFWNYFSTRFFAIMITTMTYLVSVNFVFSQCQPASVSSCNEAKVLCSLDELNGYSCILSSQPNSQGCFPLCPSGGVPDNIEWWAFTTNGGTIDILLNSSNCTGATPGLEMGLTEGCDCSHSIICNTSCQGPGLYALHANLEPCRIYYLFVDGCNGSVCNFTITTSGGRAPSINEFGKYINNDKDKIIEVCSDACGQDFFVQYQSNCNTTWRWTLDGVIQASQTNKISLNFPQEGKFTLCASAYIGNPIAGAICDQKGPICSQINVGEFSERHGGERNLCIKEFPFFWNGKFIDGPGEYRVRLSENCCNFDSVILFNTRLQTEVVNKIHIACDTLDFYIEPSTKEVFKKCINKQIWIPSNQSPEQCDSVYNLTTYFLDLRHQITYSCLDKNHDTILIEAKVKNHAPSCGLKDSIVYTYEWFYFFDSTKVISRSPQLKVYWPFGFTIYNLKIGVEVHLGNVIKKCNYYINDIGNIEKFKISPNRICPIGPDLISSGNSITYQSNSLLIPEFKYNWIITGGVITSPNPENSSSIQVQWDHGIKEGKICLDFKPTCEQTQCCKDVKIITDMTTTKSSHKIQIIPNPHQGDFRIYPVEINQVTELKIFDIHGKLWIQDKNLIVENKMILIEKSLLVPGIYTVCVIQNGRSYIEKMVVLN